MSGVDLCLLCHAPTRAVRDATFPAGEPLDPRGRAAAAAAARLRRVDAAWSSPALAAQQTADAMALAARTEPLLREVDYGAWSGRSLEAVAADDPAGMAAWLSDPGAAPHGGDRINDVFDRVSTWLAAAAGWEGRVVAVTHASVMRAAVALALTAERTAFWRIDVAPLCRVRLRGRAGQWVLRSIGR